MKMFLEEEQTINNEKVKIKVKEVASKAEAIASKTVNKCYFHKCYHDETKGKITSCTREAI